MTGRTSLLLKNIELVHDFMMTEDTLLLLDFCIRSLRMPCLDLQIVVFRMGGGDARVDNVSDCSDLLVEFGFGLSFVFLQLRLFSLEPLLLSKQVICVFLCLRCSYVSTQRDHAAR